MSGSTCVMSTIGGATAPAAAATTPRVHRACPAPCVSRAAAAIAHNNPTQPARARARHQRLNTNTNTIGCNSTRRRIVTAAAGLGDAGYWEGVVGIMTPSVNLNFGVESIAALAIGGVLVLGHSWESIEASRGWKAARDKKRAAEAAAEEAEAVATGPALAAAAATSTSIFTSTATAATAAATAATATSAPAAKPPKPPVKSRTTAAAKPQTKEEREAAIAGARAERQGMLASLAQRRGRGTTGTTTSSSSTAEITVCTNNACVKRGAKEMLANLQQEASSCGGVSVKGARCMDACGAGCIVKVNGAAGLQTFIHVGPDEAGAVLALVVGVSDI
mmetsp:Transcript_5233/g.13313  ORF Transcript_5233/g.13313 Transcript_5233/m.13313 type:complete len:334 (-) Transcript_5233:550-1551(-)